MVIIHLEYSGVVRLLLGKKGEEWQFTAVPTLKEIIEKIGEKYGEEIVQEVLHQLIFLQYNGNTEQLKWPQDQEREVAAGSLLRVISLVTGG